MKHLLFTVFLILLTGSLFGANYAVMDFVSEGGVDSGVVTGVQETFVSAFKPAGFTLISKMKINRTAEEMGIQMSTAGPDKMRPVMDKLDVTHIVVGKVIKMSGENMVSVKVFKLGSDIPMAAEQVSFPGSPIEPIKTLAQNLAKQLKGGKGGSSKPAAKLGKASSAQNSSNSQVKQGVDAKACEYARKNNTVEIWQDYLEQFPQGECAFEAKSEIKKQGNNNQNRIGGLQWSNRSPNYMNWSSAKQYCENLAEGGFTDWRLPTISELKTTIQNCQSGGSSCRVSDSCLSYSSCWSESCYCKAQSNNGDYYNKLGDEVLWSFSSCSDSPDGAWAVVFKDAVVAPLKKSGDIYVRCVR